MKTSIGTMNQKRTLLIPLLLLLLSTELQAQFSLQPQAGINLIGLSSDPGPDVEASIQLGWIVGADARIGGRGYFQPGLFYTTSRVKYDFTNAETLTSTHHGLRIKALGGVNVVDGEIFKLRFNLGPAYEIFFSHNDDDHSTLSKDDWRNGTFFAQGGLGIDIIGITLDAAYMYGFSNVFEEGGTFLETDSKYRGWVVTLGFALWNNHHLN
jgi:hypothetical protein